MVTPAQGRDGSQNFPSIFRAQPGVHRVRLDYKIKIPVQEAASRTVPSPLDPALNTYSSLQG